jgi:phosphoribosylanthranilate isomerase
MVKIKVCGLKRPEDIDYVNELKPEYIGFVFAKSKREVTLEQAKSLKEKLDKGIKTVGVFLNRDIEEVKTIAASVKLDVLQFHGDETQEYIDNFKNYECWKAETVSDIEDLEKLKDYNVDAFLLDSCVKGARGGTGESFNWESFKGIGEKYKIILAGGLDAGNVREGIRIIKPFAVDVSSGVEVDGVKNFEKIKEFIEKVREI